jgi:putative chitobiose transport system substrate-binding protein
MKRLVLLLCVLLFVALPALAQERDDRPNRDLEGPFWNAGEEQFEQWRVIEGVEEGAEIRFWPWALTPDFEDYLNKVIENFEATYPEVNVVLEGQPAAGARDNIRNSFAAGNPADVINVSDGWVAEFAESGVLMNMDEALGEAYPELRDQYFDGAWVKAAYNDTTYSIPWYLALSNFIAYNTDIMEELGYTEEDLPATIQEAWEFACQVREDSDGAYYAYSYALGEQAGLGILNNFYGEGIEIFNEEGTEVVFNTPEAVAVMEAYVNLLNNDCIPRESLTDDVREMVDRFSEGEILYVDTGIQLLRLIEENNPDVFAALELANAPTGSAGIRNIGGVQMLVIPDSTPNPNAALAFAVFLTNPEVQTAFSQEVPIYSSNEVSYEDEFFTSGEGDQLTDRVRPIAFDYFSQAEPVNLGDFPNLAEVELVVLYETQSALLGDKTPAEAVEAMQNRINEILATAQDS